MKMLEKNQTPVAEEPLIRFFYGTMRAGKSKKLIKDSLDYDQPTVFVLPEKATKGVIESRACRLDNGNKYSFVIVPDIIFGQHHPEDNDNLFDLIYEDSNKVDRVVIDEAQFLDPDDVYDIAEACSANNIKLDAYGLLTDFHGEMFDGSREWINQADKSICIEGKCDFIGCKKTAAYNCLIKQQTPPDSNVVIGDSQYIVLCPEHRELYKKAGLIEE